MKIHVANTSWGSAFLKIHKLGPWEIHFNSTFPYVGIGATPTSNSLFPGYWWDAPPVEPIEMKLLLPLVLSVDVNNEEV